MDPYSSFDYGYSYGADSEMFMIFMIVFIVLYLALILALLVIALVMYIFQSISLYTIAKRREINNPWLSWLPVGNIWIIGSISDQYQYVAKGKIRNLRKWFIGILVANYAMLGVWMVAYMIAGLAPLFGLNGVIVAIASIVSALLYLLIMAASLAQNIILYMALFDIFASCATERAVLYLLLSIFIPFALTVLLFICRNKDDGMPPRLEELEALEENAE